MCGIAGIISFERRVERAEVKIMTDAIAHRGPDGEGCWVSDDGKCGLGHRRLSIIDLSNEAAQPMTDISSRFVITFNGEIYNYIELKKDLEAKGIAFRTHSDTEVLLALYAYYGASCVNHLDGMFAFVIYDKKFRTTFAARDRFGEKPFFYSMHAGRFYFASEMKSIFAAGIERKYDPKRLHYYLAYNLYQDPDDLSTTFFQNVFQLPPAHTMSIDDNGNRRVSRYWRIDAEKESQLSMASACEKFEYLLTRSVQRRLRSDVPVGSSLSGGLDSSTIVMLIDKLKQDGQVQKTFSARFKDFAKDEGQYIEEVLSVTTAQGFSTWPGPEVLDELDKIAYHQEEPFGSASIVAQWSVMKLAKENNVTVLLDGQGADEILGGYRTFFEPLLNGLYARGDSDFELERNYLATEQSYNYNIHRNTRIMLRYPRTFKTVSSAKNIFIPRRKNVFVNKNYASGFYDEVKNLTHPSDGIYNDDVKYHQRRLIERGGFLPLLRYADRNSMAHARELRLPFLDHELVEFCIALPDRFKVSNGWTKRLLRETFKQMLPEKICWRKDKIGFEAPQTDWMKSSQINEKVSSDQQLLEANGIVERGKHFDPWHTMMAANLIRK